MDLNSNIEITSVVFPVQFGIYFFYTCKIIIKCECNYASYWQCTMVADLGVCVTYHVDNKGAHGSQYAY